MKLFGVSWTYNKFLSILRENFEHGKIFAYVLKGIMIMVTITIMDL